MALTPGTLVGPYEILSAIGAGGMDYRARDTKLKRDVALKVLPERVASDPGRLARFRREAEVLASLNHPNIAQIYGLEEGRLRPTGAEDAGILAEGPGSGRAGGEAPAPVGNADVTALVMELVEGPTLAEAIDQAPVPGSRRSASAEAQRASGARQEPQAHSLKPSGLPLDVVLPLARQIAEALEAAHEQGVIHRDLKPANIKLALRGAPRPDDGGLERRLSAADVADCTVKVLDFGLAKLSQEAQGSGPMAQDLSNSPTLTSPAMTELGVILGTASYMSPEQARGRPVDKRSDIWGFGCVLYEMLTGRRAFMGEDVTVTLTAILRDTPDWSALPDETPATVRRLLARCLEKAPKQRLHDIADARLELEDVKSDPNALVDHASASSAGAGLRRFWQRALPLPWAVTLLGIAAALAAWSLLRSPLSPPKPVTRFSIPLAPSQEFTVAGRRLLAISPDGSFVQNWIEELKGRVKQ